MMLARSIDEEDEESDEEGEREGNNYLIDDE